MALTLLIDFQSCKAFHNWNIFGKLIGNNWIFFDKILVFNPVLLNSIGIKQLFPFLLKSTVSLYDLVLVDCCNCWSGFINGKNAHQQTALLWCWYQLAWTTMQYKVFFDKNWDIHFGILGYRDMDCISSLSPSICRSQLSRGIQFSDMLIMMMLMINIGRHHQ